MLLKLLNQNSIVNSKTHHLAVKISKVLIRTSLATVSVTQHKRQIKPISILYSALSHIIKHFNLRLNIKLHNRIKCIKVANKVNS